MGRSGGFAPGRAGRTVGLATMALVALAAHTRAARAQYIERYFPAGVPGYGIEQGVTVVSRERPLYEEPSIRLGAFLLRPRWDQSFGYDSNILGLRDGPASTLLRTAGSLSASSLWGRNQLGADLTVDNYRYLSAPQQSYTNWTTSLGGEYKIGRDKLTLAYSHFSLNQTGLEVGAIPSQIPVHYDVNDLRTAYTFDLGKLSISPGLDIQQYQFSNAIIAGLPVSQSYRDRVAFTGNLTTRYALSDLRSLVLITEAIDTHFTDPQPGQPTFNSKSLLVLGGIDYQATGPWRYRLLIGAEARFFASSAFGTRAAPIGVAEVTWTPTGLTTVSARLDRTIEDPTSEDNSGYTYTTARLVVDHEFRRNLLLQGRLSYQLASYLQGGGTQSSVSAGGSVSWLLNRNLRLSLDYTFTDQSGRSQNTVAPLSIPTNGPFTRNLALITLHVGL